MDYSFEVDPNYAGQRLDKFLALQLPNVSRTRVQRWIDVGAVTVDDLIRMPKHKVRVGDTVCATEMATDEANAFSPEPMDLNVAFEDTDCIVIDKPAGLVTHPAPGNWSGTLMNGLLAHRITLKGLPRAGIVHRLDKDTTGLMVVAASEGAMLSLTEQLAARTMGRRYLAVVHGKAYDTGFVNKPIGRDPANRLRMAISSRGKTALTFWRCLDRVEYERRWFSLIECKLASGRTHQIRVHMQNAGFALVGDTVYGIKAGASNDPSHDFIQRQALHAWRLEFNNVEGDFQHAFKAVPPPDFVNLCEQLGLVEPFEAVNNSDHLPWGEGPEDEVEEDF